MLRRLRIQNFKGWQDTGHLDLAPISLFFGTNSSGKSSIGQLLMMLKQTAESSDRKAVLSPGGKNSAVQLGSFQSMVFGRDVSKNIGFEYQWDCLPKLQIKDPITNKKFEGDQLYFEGSVAMGENQPFLDRFKYQLEKDSHTELVIGLEHDSSSFGEYSISSEGYQLKRTQGRAWKLRNPVRFYGFPAEMISYHQNAEFVQGINLEHEKLFNSIYYLGPLRTKAERLYVWSGQAPESTGFSGENTIAAILSGRDRKIGLLKSRKKRAKNHPLEAIIASKLKEMGLIDGFDIKAISEQRQEYEVRIRTKGSDHEVDLPDVGFGISQVLPVLVQIFYAPANSIIIIEQPEIHLHPRAQAALADVMIEAIKAKEGGKPRNIQLIIETHSEHFLRRLQRRIAEDVIPQEMVAAWFADTTKMPARLAPLEIDDYGNIRNWPKDFFGDEMGDIAGQAKAAMAKKAAKKNGKGRPNA